MSSAPNNLWVLAFIRPDWQFPVTLHLGSWHVPIHPVFDMLAYFFGFRLYLYLKKRSRGTQLSWEENAWIFVGCIFGALVGAKVLAWAESPGFYWSLRHDPHFWYGGKTIVGGLIGGWMGVELAKKCMGITVSTGDVCVFPLILGMCVGRIGCFLTGVSDETCGVPTQLPWGVDYGDGIPRHPAQIYEILFLIGLGTMLWIMRASFTVPGMRFRWFLTGYLSFRLCVDFLKPHEIVFGGLSGIQWGCVLALAFCAWSLIRLPQLSPQPSHV